MLWNNELLEKMDHETFLTVDSFGYIINLVLSNWLPPLKRLFSSMGASDPHYKSRYVYFAIQLLVGLYVFAASTATEPFNCVYQAGSEKYIMYKNPSQNCFEGTWNDAIGVSIASLLVYVVAVPSILFGIIYKNQADLFNKRKLAYLGVLVHPYRYSLGHWELVNLVRKILIVCTVNLLPQFDVGQLQLLLLIVVLFTNLLLHVNYQPYVLAISNRLSTAWMVTAILSIFSASFFGSGIKSWERTIFECLVMLFFFRNNVFFDMVNNFGKTYKFSNSIC